MIQSKNESNFVVKNPKNNGFQKKLPLKILRDTKQMTNKKKKNPKEGKFSCKFCQKPFNYFKTYHIHESTQACSICKICGRKMFSNNTLKHHMKIHTGEKPHSCEKCDKTFRLAYCLERHSALRGF